MRQILRNYRVILEQERRLGYTNASVFGGFAAFVEGQCREALQVVSSDEEKTWWQRTWNLSREYLNRPPSRRAEVISQLAAALDRLAAMHRDKLEPAPARHNRSHKPMPGKPAAPRQNKIEKKKSVSPTGKSDLKPPGDLGTSVKYLKGVGPQRSRILERLGIVTIKDLLYYLPRGYQDRSSLPVFSQLEPKEGLQTVRGKIAELKENAPRRLRVVRARLADGTGTLTAVWFNQPHLMRLLKPGDEVIITGRVVDNFPYGFDIQVREFEKVGEEESPHSQRIVPIYPTTEGMPVKTLRQLIHLGLKTYSPQVDDPLPKDLRLRRGLHPLRRALWGVHFPEDIAAAEKSRQRLAFDELFFFQLGLALLRQWRSRTPGVVHQPQWEYLQRFIASLPFRLTGAQKRAVKEIVSDLSQPAPMNRLLQGDVGSGKTVVAAAALVQCAANGYQGAVMVPTEILAEQHYRSINALLAPLSLPVALLRGNQPRRVREEVLQQLKDGTLPLVVGTQALIQEGVDFKALGLVVIDEQHRFGVRQRALLQQKGSAPHLLVMTATPIPRSLALTFYGDLDLSIIDELPPGRMPVKTYCTFGPSRDRLFNLVSEEVRKGRQAYFVCPLVEESEVLDVEAATRLSEELRQEVFPHFQVGLLHGRMKSDEKEQVMRRFRDGEIDILVSTTVVEVGVDVPNASVMVIEDAGRFGLAQLHQLRGRIGRGAHQGYCLLAARSPSPEVRQRLAVLESTNDGFQVAEEDLKLRGPGEYLGIKQHGSIEWKIADLSRDLKILEAARQEARWIVEQDADLSRQENQKLYAEARAKLKDLDFPVKV